MVPALSLSILVRCQRLPFDEGFHRHVWPSWVLGHDRYGHPVVLERLAALDWDRALRLSTYDLVQMRIQSLEALQAECARLSLQLGCRVYKVLYIVDVGGASSWTLMNSKVIEFAKLYAKVLEQLFADAAWMNLVVNAPAIARATWGIVERVVDEETRAIVRFLPVGDSCFDALVDAGVPSEIIPRHLGGSAPMGTLVADLIDKQLDFAKEGCDKQESTSQRVQSSCDDDDSSNMPLNKKPTIAEYRTVINLPEKKGQSHLASSDCTQVPWHMLILRAPGREGASHLSQALACILWVIARPFIIALTRFVGLVRATRLLFNTPSES